MCQKGHTKEASIQPGQTFPIDTKVSEMTPESMAAACMEAINDRTGAITGVTFALPKGWKRPPGFPRGKLLSEVEREGKMRVYSFDPLGVLAWLAATGMVKVTAKLKTTNEEQEKQT